MRHIAISRFTYYKILTYPGQVGSNELGKAIRRSRVLEELVFVTDCEVQGGEWVLMDDERAMMRAWRKPEIYEGLLGGEGVVEGFNRPRVRFVKVVEG